MAKTTQPDTADATSIAPPNTQANGAASSSPELAPVLKVTRARATTSGVPTPARGPKATAASAPAATSRSAAGPAARPANIEIHQGGADSVSGDSVSITQGGASIVNARTVDIRQGGIANAQADDITVSMGGVALARADRVSVEMGGLGIAFAREAHVTQGVARSVIAQDVRVDQGLVGTAIAGKVTFERPSGVFLLIAGKTDGPVNALLDWRGALAFGAVFGVVTGLIRRRR